MIPPPCAGGIVLTYTAQLFSNFYLFLSITTPGRIVLSDCIVNSITVLYSPVQYPIF